MRQAGELVVEQPRDAQRPRRTFSIDPQWADGWLTFETQRPEASVGPYPTDWTGLSD
jgi:hypothetical protein